MFLIEYADGRFVNAEEINEVFFEGLEIYFYIAGLEDSKYVVSESNRSTFLNHLDALNTNFSIQARYNALNGITP